MLHILFVIYNLSKEAGNSLQAFNLAKQISLTKHQVTFITTNINEKQRRFFKNKKIKCYHLNIKNEKVNPLIIQSKLLKIIKQVLSKEDVDLIQLFDPISTGILGLYALIKYQKPIIIRLGTIFEKFYASKLKSLSPLLKGNIDKIFEVIIEKLLKLYIQLILINSSVIISNSYFIENYYKNSIYEDKMFIIPNGVDLRIFSENKFNFNENDFGLYIGRIEPRKSINMIIKAYFKLSNKSRPERLYLIGDHELDPNYTKILKELIKKLDLDHKIIFKGFVNQKYLYNYYKNARYTIFSSNDCFFPITEGLPNVILEAMASGSIIVASDIAGVPEIIRDCENGFIYNSHS
ncbi:MAG: glycosyltransferase, partial [Candidatus Lokiarchaeota archaeon]